MTYLINSRSYSDPVLYFYLHAPSRPLDTTLNSLHQRAVLHYSTLQSDTSTFIICLRVVCNTIRATMDAMFGHPAKDKNGGSRASRFGRVPEPQGFEYGTPSFLCLFKAVCDLYLSCTHSRFGTTSSRFSPRPSPERSQYIPTSPTFFFCPSPEGSEFTPTSPTTTAFSSPKRKTSMTSPALAPRYSPPHHQSRITSPILSPQASVRPKEFRPMKSHHEGKLASTQATSSQKTVSAVESTQPEGSPGVNESSVTI